MIPVIQGNLETLEQALTLLSSLTDDGYQFVATPYVGSSIGQHMRHILDNYQVLMAGMTQPPVDYNQRRRGSSVETCRQQAMDEIVQLQQWLSRLSEKQISAPLSIISEVCLQETHSDCLASTVHRELIFVASHCVHHMALIGVAIKLQDLDVPKYFGLAPATATYARQLEKQPDA